MTGVATLDPKAVAAHADTLMERMQWPRERLLAHQHERLRATLQRAVEASPYYRARIGALVERDAPFDEFPVLTKPELMANFDTIVTDPSLTRTRVEEHLSGPDAGALLQSKYRTVATGGTSGVRGLLVYDEAGWLSSIANSLRLQRMLGVGPSTRSVGIGAPSPLHVSHRWFVEVRASRPASPSLDVTMPIEAVVAALNIYQPEAITTYPSFMRTLAAERRAGRLAIQPLFFRSGAEALTTEVADLVREAWGVPVYNGYASTEVGVMAQECTRQDGMHLAEDLTVYEVVNDRNERVPHGQWGTRVLVTTLCNEVMPLIRYELSDIVVLDDHPCPCGCSFLRVRSIEGRREDLLRFVGTNGGFVDIPALRLRMHLVGAAEIRQFQVARMRDGLAITIALEPGANETEATARVERRTREILAAHKAQVGTLEVNVVASIERTGSAAKERIVTT